MRLGYATVRKNAITPNARISSAVSFLLMKVKIEKAQRLPSLMLTVKRNGKNGLG